MGALREMDTLLTEQFEFAFLPSQPLVPLSPFCSTQRPLDITGKSSACWVAMWDAVSQLGSREEEGALAMLWLLAPAACHLSLVLSALFEVALAVTAVSENLNG